MPKKSVRNRLFELSNLLAEADESKKENITCDIRKYIDNINIKYDYEKRYTIKTIFDFKNSFEYKRVVGDFEKFIFPDSNIDAVDLGDKFDKQNIQNIVKINYIPAIRNVEAELGRENNILSSIVRKVSENLTAEKWDNISSTIDSLNSKLNEVDEMKNLSRAIHEKIEETVGNHYSFDLIHKVAMSSNPYDVLKQFKLYGSNLSKEIKLDSRSLGDNNITFFALKLLENIYVFGNTKSYLNLLLIEEPEAHIHKHLQKSLFSGVTNLSDCQLIISTHSVHISESSNISSVVVMLKKDNAIVACNPTLGLSDQETRNLERYLDANRIPILFSKNVILVEGTAELILIPAILKYLYGFELDNFGISLISVDSTFFEPLSKMFHENRIKEKCVILTDGDKDYTDDKKFADKEKRANDRISKLINDNLSNEYIKVYNNSYSFELDFFAMNKTVYLDFIKVKYNNNKLYAIFLEKFNSNLPLSMFEMIEKKNNEIGKGWQALEFVNFLEAQNKQIKISEYISNALLYILKDRLSLEIVQKMIHKKRTKFNLEVNELLDTSSPNYDFFLSKLYER